MPHERDIRLFAAVRSAWSELGDELADVSESRPSRPGHQSKFFSDRDSIVAASDHLSDKVIAARAELLTLAAEDLLTSVDCIRGLARGASALYGATGPAYSDPSPMAVARSLWELAARVAWTFDPHTPVEKRLARFLGSAIESGRYLDLYHRAGSAVASEKSLRIMLEQWAQDAELAATKFRPTNEGASVMPDGERGYRFLSGFTHGAPLTIGMGVRRRVAGSEIAVSWHGYDLSTHVRAGVFAIQAAGKAVQAFDAYWAGSVVHRSFDTIRDNLVSAGR